MDKQDGKTIAVYDLGGGTFDVSILEIALSTSTLSSKKKRVSTLRKTSSRYSAFAKKLKRRRKSFHQLRLMR